MGSSCVNRIKRMICLPNRGTYYIEVYGCQMNFYDADLLANILDGAGYRPAPVVQEADVILVNTCSVREHAEHRAMGRIRELAGMKKEHPKVRLVVCGCMAQRMGSEMLRQIPGIDVVLGTDGYRDLPELLRRSETARIVETSVCAQEIYSQLVPRYDGEICAFVGVMRGCDNRCSYCIVPQLRGRARSRPLEDIVREVSGLVDRGCRQVTFLGQNVNLFGDGQNRFADLLRKTNEISHLWRIRFISSHPRDMDEGILVAMAESAKVCEHLHLPIQSGSNKILRAMRRGYTTQEYRSIVLRARELMPGLSITTDLIAGFPGETNGDFQETIKLMRELEFDDAFTFQYSPRPGTEAAKMSDQVPLDEQHRRLEQLIALQLEITKKINSRQVGRTIEILVERQSRRKTKELMGRTRNHKVVIFPGDVKLVGRLVHVKVKSVRGKTAWGEIIPDDQEGIDRRAAYRRRICSSTS